jgi:hypothetical protein
MSETTGVRPHALLAALGALLVCCEQAEPRVVEPECSENAFRACELEACRGVQQCLPPGAWGTCSCAITDAAFPEAATDAASDANFSDADSADGS